MTESNTRSKPDRATPLDVIGADASAPGCTEMARKSWVTGDEPMTGAQRSYLYTLTREAGVTLHDDLTKAEASEHIDRLQESTGLGAWPGAGSGSAVGRAARPARCRRRVRGATPRSPGSRGRRGRSRRPSWPLGGEPGQHQGGTGPDVVGDDVGAGQQRACRVRRRGGRRCGRRRRAGRAPGRT